MITRRRVALLAGAGALVLVAVAGALGAAGTASQTGPAAASLAAASGGTTTPGTVASAYVRSDGGDFLRPDRLTRVEELSRVGVLEPSSGIAVANLTVRPGQYTVRYGFEVRLDAAYQPFDLRCGVVDTNGIQTFLIDDPRPVLAGSGWESHSAWATFSLPDITLGVRCFPTATGFGQASFRDVTLSVTTIPY